MINFYTIVGILSIVRRFTPPRAPDNYSSAEKIAYDTGWRDCALLFEDSALDMLQREVAKD